MDGVSDVKDIIKKENEGKLKKVPILCIFNQLGELSILKEKK